MAVNKVCALSSQPSIWTTTSKNGVFEGAVHQHTRDPKCLPDAITPVRSRVEERAAEHRAVALHFLVYCDGTFALNINAVRRRCNEQVDRSARLLQQRSIQVFVAVSTRSEDQTNQFSTQNLFLFGSGLKDWQVSCVILPSLSDLCLPALTSAETWSSAV